jgi:hypothetical protein
MKRSVWSPVMRGLALGPLCVLLTLELTTTAFAPAAGTDSTEGDQMLARATSDPGLRSYAVPVNFAVRLRKPIRIRTRAEGMAYFKAPAQAVLTIAKAGGILGGLFKGSYNVDIAPQAWTEKYHVVSVETSVVAGAPVEVLHARPRSPEGDLDQVVFELARPALTVAAAQWQYRDGSSINLTYTNEVVGRHMLPQAASISVDMPRYRFDANATFGSYALNAPVPDTVIAAAK